MLIREILNILSIAIVNYNVPPLFRPLLSVYPVLFVADCRIIFIVWLPAEDSLPHELPAVTVIFPFCPAAPAVTIISCCTLPGCNGPASWH